MNKRLFYFLINSVLIFVFCECGSVSSQNYTASKSLHDNNLISHQKKEESAESIKNIANQQINAEIPVGLKNLLKSYPEHLKSASQNTLLWKDNTTMIYDDGIANKEYDTLLNSPDLEDQMMAFPYPAGRNYVNPPPVNYDPGRIRYEPFFLKMYGKTVTEVKARLVPVVWLKNSVNQIIMITSVNGINKKLQAVSDELDVLPADLKRYVLKPAGTFNWRKIKNTERFSPHSFGIAIDITTKYANYWECDKPGSVDRKLLYKNRIPMEIIEIFEKHGFIWGGKWYHYDTMHFEYRPELLIESEKNG